MTSPIASPSVATASSRAPRDRREFLQTSAALAAGLVVADRPGAAACRTGATAATSTAARAACTSA